MIIKIVSFYTPIFKIGISKALLNFLKLLKKIIEGQNLRTGPQCFDMTNNILTGENLWIFKHKFRLNINDTMTN